MRYYLLFLTFLSLANHLTGQVSITFQLQTEDLRENGLFSCDAGDRVFVRGSFNGWSGTDYELKKSETSDIFSGEFNIGKIGDTISYKFVIEKGNHHFFWETNPNPANPDNGNRELVLGREKIVVSPDRFRYDEYFSYPVIFPRKALQEDYTQFRHILEATHPALYDYTTREVLDSIFNSNYEQIDSDQEFSKFLILMTEVISEVGCGHSSLWVPDKYWNVAPEKLFPLKLVISDHKVLVRGTYSDAQSIPLGSEIISINCVPMHLIVNRLASLTSADGFNSSYRLTKVAQNFAVKYAFAFGFHDSFNVEYLSPGNQHERHTSIPSVSKELIDKGKPDLSELSFNQITGTKAGILTINTFGYYGEVDMFHHFIDSVFQEIDRMGITQLILDLRGNSGGDPFCASYLWGYLEPEPLPYFEEHYGQYDTLANPIPQPMNHFKGALYTLIDGNGFSTTGHFCGLLQYHDIGTFIGSELGSTFTCTGNATYPPLKNTGIMVGTARVRRYTAAVKDMDPRRGVMPDYPIEIAPNDIIEGRDPVMEYSLSLINKNR